MVVNTGMHNYYNALNFSILSKLKVDFHTCDLKIIKDDAINLNYSFIP